MTGNRLKVPTQAEAIGVRRSEEEMREWCWSKNQQCRDAGYAHWLYVHRDKATGSLVSKSRAGADALDVIKLLNGIKPEYVGWEEDRLASEERILRYCARMGMPEAIWNERFSNRVGVN